MRVQSGYVVSLISHGFALTMAPALVSRGLAYRAAHARVGSPTGTSMTQAFRHLPLGYKISHVSTVHPPFDVRIFHKECRSLAEAGFDVSFVVPHEHDERIDNISIVGLPKPRNRVIRMLVTSALAFVRALATRARIYHIHDPELVPVGLLLKIVGKKVIYDAHEDLPRQIMIKNWISPALRPLVAHVAEKFEEFAVRCFDSVVAATPVIGERFRKFNGSTVVVNNYPLPREFQKTVDWDNRERAVCYLGLISRARGIEEIIRALDYADVTLHLAGSFSDEGLLQEMKRLPSWSRVRYYGFIDRQQVMSLMSQCKVGLVCLHPTPNYVDSQPIKLYEYWGAALPVVASNFPRWVELIEGNQCGLCVDPKKPELIARAISHLLAHDSEARRMGENGRRLVETAFNWKCEEEKLLRIYSQLVGK